MARNPISTATTTETAVPAMASISTGVPISMALPGYTIIPTIRADMQVTMTNMQLSAVATPIGEVTPTPLAAAPTAVSPRPFAETGIPPRQTSGTPVWMWPVTLVAIVLIGAFTFWYTRPAPKVSTATGSSTTKIPPTIPKEGNLATQIPQSSYQGTGRECTSQVTTNCVINNNTGRVVMILRNGDRVPYLCPDTKNGVKICSVTGDKREELPGGYLIDHRKITFDNRVVVALSR